MAGVWVFDVDGTLIGSVRSDRTRPGASALLQELARRHVTVVLWSAGGAEYAARKAREHRLWPWVGAVYEKAERDAQGRYRVDHFPPHHRPDVFVDDSPSDVPLGCMVLPVTQFLGSNSTDGGMLALLADLDALVLRAPVEGRAASS